MGHILAPVGLGLPGPVLHAGKLCQAMLHLPPLPNLLKAAANYKPEPGGCSGAAPKRSPGHRPARCAGPVASPAGSLGLDSMGQTGNAHHFLYLWPSELAG